MREIHVRVEVKQLRHPKHQHAHILQNPSLVNNKNADGGRINKLIHNRI